MISEVSELGYLDSFILRIRDYLAFIAKLEGKVMAHLWKSAYL